MINARELYEQNGLKGWGIADGKLLKLAQMHGYIIITRDVRLVVRANKQKTDIIYAYGGRGSRWVWIPKEIEVSNRGHLKKLYNTNIYHQRHDLIVVPYFARGSI